VSKPAAIACVVIGVILLLFALSYFIGLPTWR
jgi:hypothetical protein